MIALRRFGGKVVRFWCLGAAVWLFGLVGCASWRVHDEGFRENELSKVAKKVRAPKQDGEAAKDANYSSLSEKGRQIERDLHSL